MSTLVIEGGHQLKGRINIPGSKNAATPILAACLLTQEECVIHNVPDISDVAKMLELLRQLGVSVKQTGSTVLVRAQNVTLQQLDRKLIKAMRSSLLLFGPLLARLGEVKLPEPGGCIIGRRPLDAHLQGLAQLGVAISSKDDSYVLQVVAKLTGAHIVLPEFSVTATENVLMAAVGAVGQTIIDTAATEPHVQDLCNFLVAMGARIHGIGTHHLVVDGVTEFRGTTHTLIPDSTEAGTWAVLGAVGKGELSIGPIIPAHLDLPLLKLKLIGVDYRIDGDSLVVNSGHHIKSFKLQTMPYPGFPTELQAPFAILATQASGSSLIHDPLYEVRMNHIAELIKMVADAVNADPNRVIISGPTPLYGREIRSFDLRAGATLIIAALIAQGETIIHDVEVVDRGYEKIVERLQAVGAHIKRLD